MKPRVQPLALRRLSGAQALLRQRLGSGLRLALGADSALHLRLAPAPFTQAPATAIDCACGLLWLDDASFMLGQWSSCPALVLDDAPEDDWYWPLYNHYLAAPLRAVLEPLRVVRAEPVDGLDCLLEWRGSAGEASVSRLRAPAQTLLNLLQHPDWHSAPQPAPSANPCVRLPLQLGRCTLPANQLAQLQPGDVLLAESAAFTAEGDGSLDVGRCRLHLRQLPGPTLRFTLTELEDLPMNVPLDPCSLDDNGLAPFYLETGEAPHSPAERFDDLPLRLTLRAGSLSLSLGQLRALTPGAVLAVSGCIPGEASLYQGERAVAHGEMVEIEGRLGLQVTRLEPRP